MPTLLAITVGGACAPIVSAIQAYQPDYVYFIVTRGQRGSRDNVDGPGDPCGDPRKATCPECQTTFHLGDPSGANIVTQTGLSDTAWEPLILDEPDAFSRCYAQTYTGLTRLAENHPDWRLIADYTGGTKTMTAALAAVALELGWELSLVKGSRLDLVKVRSGTEIASLVNAAEVRAHRRMAEARRLFDAYAYASAAQVLGSTLREAPLAPDLQHEIHARVTLCRAFHAWDLFQHRRARQLLEPYQSRCVPQWIFVKQLTREQPGYAPVGDLLRNAERRAARGRYDDAVARLYRALELLAQTRLQAAHNLDSGAIPVARLPSDLQRRYEARRDPADQGVKLGLCDDYELLTGLEDPLGLLYREWQHRLLDVLGHRNRSILAHGLEPVGEEAWQRMREIVSGYLEAGLQALSIRLKAPQFPTWQGTAPRR